MNGEENVVLLFYVTHKQILVNITGRLRLMQTKQWRIQTPLKKEAKLNERKKDTQRGRESDWGGATYSDKMQV